MPAQESKPAAGAEEVRKGDDPENSKGKQPAVESDEDESEGDNAPTTQDTGAPAAAGKKKKKSKKKKKDKAEDNEAKLKKAIGGLSAQQQKELLALNPALAKELNEGSSSTGGLSEALKSMSLQDIMTGLAASGKNAKDMGAYKFWQTQLVPKFGETEDFEEGPLKVQTLDEVPKTPATLPEPYEWVTMDLENDQEMADVWELLNGHYVEDDEAMFRFNYSKAILKWAIMSPGWRKDWHIGVRASTSKKLVAFIAGIPITMRIRGKIFKSSEVNFICVHKKLRNKRLAPVLIKEITRRINLQEIWQAVYTAGVVLPRPVSTSRYYHRPLNWMKLYEVGFSPLPKNSKPQYQVRKYQVPEETSVRGLREMQMKDIDQVMKLWDRYQLRWDMAPQMDKEEFEHWFLHKKDSGLERVIWTYVVEDDKKNITDFFSFYCLESSVINSSKHQNVRAAYLFYYGTESGLTVPYDRSAHKKRMNALMNDALVLAKRYKFDVFNALSLMDNGTFITEQKFGAGDGQLHFYMFNYRAHPIAGGVDKSNQIDEDHLSGIGLVML